MSLATVDLLTLSLLSAHEVAPDEGIRVWLVTLGKWGARSPSGGVFGGSGTRPQNSVQAAVAVI